MRFSSTTAHLVLALGAIMLPGCANGIPEPQQPKEHGERLCAFHDPDPITRLMQWSLGCDVLRRQAEPPSAAATVLWYTTRSPPSFRLGKRLSRQCVEASSLLPAPGGEVYLVSAGLLFWLDKDGTRRRVRIQSADPNWRFSYLLGFDRKASPLKILAVMASASGSKKHELPWLFTVKGGVATGEPYADIGLTNDAQRLVKHFVLPRCAGGYSECLVVSNTDQASYLGLERNRGDASKPVQGAGTLHVLDAAWASAKDRTVVLLASGCIR